jgi:hypothetical protein
MNYLVKEAMDKSENMDFFLKPFDKNDFLEKIKV